MLFIPCLTNSYLIARVIIRFFFLVGRKYFFRPITRLKKTRFLPTEKEKLHFILGSKKRLPQIAVYRPWLRLGW